MFEWVTIDLLRMMMVGAIVGAGIRFGYFALRDWKYQTLRWRYRNRPARGEDAYFEELREPEGYKPNAVTPEERAALTEEVFLFASMGAFAGASIHLPEITPQALFMVLALFTVVRIVWIVLTTPTPVVAAAGVAPPTRWRQIAPLLLELAIFAFFGFGFMHLVEWLDTSGMLAGTMFNGFGFVMCLGFTVFGLLSLIEGPPEDADWREISRWQSATYMMIGALPLAAFVFGALSLIG